MKRPFNKEDRIASAPSIEALTGLLVKFFCGSAIRIEDGQVFNAKGPIESVGIFVEGNKRFWAYFKNEVTK